MTPWQEKKKIYQKLLRTLSLHSFIDVLCDVVPKLKDQEQPTFCFLELTLNKIKLQWTILNMSVTKMVARASLHIFTTKWKINWDTANKMQMNQIHIAHLHNQSIPMTSFEM